MTPDDVLALATDLAHRDGQVGRMTVALARLDAQLKQAIQERETAGAALCAAVKVSAGGRRLWAFGSCVVELRGPATHRDPPTWNVLASVAGELPKDGPAAVEDEPGARAMALPGGLKVGT